jgi:hypothetical protein
MPTPEATELLEPPSQPATGKYLEFRRLPEMLDHLGERGIGCVHLDDTVRHDPTDHAGIGCVAVYAVVSQDLGTHVAVWGQLVGREPDVFRQGRDELEAFRARGRGRLDKVRALLEARGLRVLPGIWSHRPPRYL